MDQTYDDNVGLFRQRLGETHALPNCVRRFQRFIEPDEDFHGAYIKEPRTRNDALQLCAHPEAPQRLLISRNDVLGPSRVLQPGVLGTDTWVVEASADGVRLDDLTCAGLQDVRPDAVEHTRDALAERSGVVVAVQT